MGTIKREFKRRLLSFLHNVQYKVERRRLEPVINSFNPEVVDNIYPDSISSILFIVTRMVRFHGGQTSVLRLGTQLAKMGYKVIYTSYKPQSIKEMKLCAVSNLKDYRGELYGFNEYLELIRQEKAEMPDVAVASSWDTVSYVKKLNSYRMYFIQDYEPYFYEFGERFLMAKATYEQGLHMVSLGGWNKEMILKEAYPVSEIDVISFPYEKSEYKSINRDYVSYKDKTEIKLAVYLKFYGKRLPNLIPRILIATAEKLREKGITLSVSYFGEAGLFRPAGGKNLGMLNKAELSKLYSDSDFGMVASMSNISLVPYEMISTGLPIIEFSDGTFPYFFPENTALLTNIGEREFSTSLLSSINTPGLLELRHNRAMKYMNKLSWENTGREFASILERVSGK